MHIKSYCAAHRHGLFSPQSNAGRAVLSLAFALVLTVVGLISIFDTDKTVSEDENRKLAAKPKFSFTALLIRAILRILIHITPIHFLSEMNFSDSTGKYRKYSRGPKARETLFLSASRIRTILPARI